MKKRIGFAMVLVLMLGIVSAIGKGTDAAAESTGKYVSDLQFRFTSGVNVPDAWNNRVPDPDSWSLIPPDGETEHDVEMEGEKVFAYAKAYVKRTDDPSMALTDITIRTDGDGSTQEGIYDVVLPRTQIYNSLYTTRDKNSGDPICDIYFVKDSLDCNGAEFAFNRVNSQERVPYTSFSARAHELQDTNIPVYTVYLRDNLAQKYVSGLKLVKGDSDKVKMDMIYKGYKFIKNVELGGEAYTLGIVRTDSVKEALRGVYLVDKGSSYKLYTSKSEGAGTAILDVCPKSEMLVSEGETTTVGNWVQKYFQGDSFRDFVKNFVVNSDTAYKKNKNSSLRCIAGEVKQYDDLSVLKADMGFEESIRSGVNVEAGSGVSDAIAVVRRDDAVKTGNIILSGVKGIGTNDPEKLESFRAQIEPEVEETESPGTDVLEAPDEDDGTVDLQAASGDGESKEEADTTGTLTSSGAWLWIVLSVAVVLIVVVVIIAVRKKKSGREDSNE